MLKNSISATDGHGRTQINASVSIRVHPCPSVADPVSATRQTMSRPK
jgi:hypothetical protein